MLSQGELSENQIDWIKWAEKLLTLNDPIELACKQASMAIKINGQLKVSKLAIDKYFGMTSVVPKN